MHRRGQGRTAQVRRRGERRRPQGPQPAAAPALGDVLPEREQRERDDAVRRVAAGERLWQPAVTDRLLRALLDRPALLDGAAGADGIENPEPLTARELDVLRLLAAGWSNREIAQTLHLAPGTVKNHVSAVLLKLGVRDRTRAVLRALDLGLLGA
ncbi:response regulator transcription factor [Cellulomonas sp. zg-ZUI199]|uniref:Response regulator transcription factor n=1 Tax=Cellulomonas wangleii TaxID=2816956 RepID=A0ABX8DBJ7_9CELL|nr:response regulator transcription factor [Cellulomonas wangleii]MBO0924594.1 response regulator transcription factor [Cellulomonas wangleii]QVI64016.1 response regulator transcription factor [Cellulomonas wangleii]